MRLIWNVIKNDWAKAFALIKRNKRYLGLLPSSSFRYFRIYFLNPIPIVIQQVNALNYFQSAVLQTHQ